MNKTDVFDTMPQLKTIFSWYDYVIFTIMLGFSVLIGIYFGCFGTKQATTTEYLMGGKKMSVIPIAISLVASHISGITLLGVPADIYRFGSTYWLGLISFFVMAILSIYVYMPVFFNLQITSTYEYLQRRFDNRTRMFSSFLFALSQVLFLPVVVYIPALAFEAATGIDLHIMAPIVCSICIFYTTIGGLKAVVWTDTIQFTITIGSVIVVLFLGIKSAGGFLAVWQKAVEGDRLDIFNFDPDFTQRDNFWAVSIGFTFLWISTTNTNQGCVQKFLSVATLREARLAVIYYALGMAFVKTASVFTGLAIYARYSNCDPFATKQITRSDQLLPYYVLDVAGHIPCLSGLFIAGVFSAGLSTLSAHLNCVAGTIFEDFVSKFLHKNITEQTKSNILKLIVVIFGIICTALVFIVEHLGGILALTISFNSVTAGPLLGMFTLGVLFRRANANGAFFGGIIGLVFIFWLTMMAQYYKANGEIFYPQKPLYTDECSYSFNSTIEIPQFNKTGGPEIKPSFSIFKITHYYYTLVGFTITMISGLLISYLTKPESRILDENLFSPIIQKQTKLDSQMKEQVEYHTVDNALTLVVNNCEKDN